MRPARWAGVAASAAAIAGAALLACSSFTETPSSEPDGGAEGGDRDTGPIARPDGARADASCSASYCACYPSAAFCSDFDTKDDPFGAWQNINGLDGGVGVATSTQSPPNALHVKTEATALDASPPVAFLSRTIDGDMSALSLSFDMTQPANCPTGMGDVIFLDVEGANAAVPSRFQLLLTPSGLKMFVKDGADETTTSDLLALPNVKEWTHVTIKTTSGALVVSYDGAPAHTAIPLGTFTSTSFIIRLGLQASAGINACDAKFDNVLVSLP